MFLPCRLPTRPIHRGPFEAVWRRDAPLSGWCKATRVAGVSPPIPTDVGPTCGRLRGDKGRGRLAPRGRAVVGELRLLRGDKGSRGDGNVFR